MPESIPKITGLVILEGTDINPNGDPDAEGAPRQDPETGHGMITPQAISSRIMRRVGAMNGFAPPYNIQIRRDTTIADGIVEGAAAAGVELPSPSGEGKKKKIPKLSSEDRNKATRGVCDTFFDTRMRGNVLNVGNYQVENVNGVVTLGGGRSVYPVTVIESAITRACPTNPGQDKTREMGRSYKVAHGVYKQPFFVNPHHAVQNGATLKDLSIYIDSLINAYEFCRSGMSGQVNLRGLWMFRHESMYGNAPAHMLLDRVQVSSDKGEDARSWADYNLRFDASGLPETIKVYTLENLLGGSEAILKTLSE